MTKLTLALLAMSVAFSVAASAADEQPRLLKRVEPVCTALAKQAAVSGSVILSYTIFEDGQPANIVVAKGMGYGLNDEAAKALAQWRYTEGKRDGKPARFAAATEFKFECTE